MLTSGRQAEQAVAEYLKTQGYKIIAQNWRSKIAEVDVIAVKNNAVNFVEVKYRQNLDFGSGFDYINSKKLRKMGLGAELWVSQNKWPGDYRLMAASVSGSDFDDIELIEIGP